MPSEAQPSGSEREDPEMPERWSAKRKVEIVLRLLRGEALGPAPAARRRGGASR
jgi:hypothetical protein